VLRFLRPNKHAVPVFKVCKETIKGRVEARVEVVSILSKHFGSWWCFEKLEVSVSVAPPGEETRRIKSGGMLDAVFERVGSDLVKQVFELGLGFEDVVDVA
jgi:hypothetical protein